MTENTNSTSSDSAQKYRDSIGLSAEELLTTTRSVRKRLDLERPVETSLIMECIEMAIQAPTGSNAQRWAFMIVDDPEKKAAIAEYYRAAFYPYREMNSGVEMSDQNVRVTDSASYLAEVLQDVPAFVIPLHRGRVEGLDAMMQASYWGSILPAAWSLMLALRSKGLGSAWTTLHLPSEKPIAELLGIDYDKWTQAGLFPVAYTKGLNFKLAKRVPVEKLVHRNTFGSA